MNSYPTIRALTFDIDDTLWDFSAALAHAETTMLAELYRLIPNAKHVNVAHMERIRIAVAREMDKHKTQKSWLGDVRREALLRLTKPLTENYAEIAEHLFKTFGHTLFGDVRLHDDVVATLDILRHDYKLGIITNGNTSLERSGILPWFDAKVIAHEQGVLKPDPTIFYHASDVLGVRPEEIMHIGDALVDDVAGSRYAGMVPVWFNPHGKTNDTIIQPDYEIASLSELVAILAGNKAAVRA